ncbi:MAG: hypothetical protein AB7J28_11870 [Hyphomonadaceae bacterium]
MNWRLFWMIVGSFVCVGLIFVSRDSLLQAPALLEVDLSSVNQIVASAYILSATALPVVCLLSLLRGWLAWVGEDNSRALGRLWTWPLAVGAVCAALFAVGRIATA